MKIKKEILSIYKYRLLSMEINAIEKHIDNFIETIEKSYNRKEKYKQLQHNEEEIFEYFINKEEIYSILDYNYYTNEEIYNHINIRIDEAIENYFESYCDFKCYDWEQFINDKNTELWRKEIKEYMNYWCDYWMCELIQDKRIAYIKILTGEGYINYIVGDKVVISDI